MKGDAATDSASVCVHVRMCASEGVCVAEIITNTQWAMCEWEILAKGREISWTERGHTHHLLLTNKNSALPLYIQS